MKFKTGEDNSQYETDNYNNVMDVSPTATSGPISEKGNSARLKVGLALLLVIIVVFCIYTMITCPRIGECKKLADNLQTACNELDLLGIADCMNPTIRNALYIAVPAGAALTNTSTDDFLRQVIDMVGGDILGMTENSGLQLSEVFQRVTIKPIRFGLPARQRAIVCRLSLGGITQDVRVYIMKKYGEVYINKIELAR